MELVIVAVIFAVLGTLALLYAAKGGKHRPKTH
jgi:hypothetical protein